MTVTMNHAKSGEGKTDSMEWNGASVIIICLTTQSRISIRLFCIRRKRMQSRNSRGFVTDLHDHRTLLSDRTTHKMELLSIP